MIYRPDKWVVIEIKTKESTHQRVFAGWFGGFGYGASWKMNSGIVSVKDDGSAYIFTGESGSEYHCPKELYGMTSYMQYVLYNYREIGDDNYTITVVDSYNNKM